MKSLDIILPVYNEEAALPAFHRDLKSLLIDVSKRYRVQVIYVVDRSEDRSYDLLTSIAREDATVRVLHLSRRFGHQMSLVAGMDHSHGDAVIMMDCDLQHPVSVIPLLLEKFEEGYEVVQTLRMYSPETGFLKRWTSKAFYVLQNALSPVEIKDGAADFRLISRKVANVFRDSVREQNQFLRGLFYWVGFNNTTVSFTSPPREKGRTKYNLIRLLTFSIGGITSFSKIPLRLSMMLGFAISGLSVFYGVYILINYLWVGHFPAGYASLIMTMLFIGGLQLMVLGIMGEYIGAIFDESKHRPLYIVDEVYPKTPTESIH